MASFEWDEGVDSNVNPSVLEAIKLIQGKARELGIKNLRGSSGYRDPERNARVGGSAKSQHITRDAADIHWDQDKWNPETRQQMVSFMKSQPGFGQVLDEEDHVHFGVGGKMQQPVAQRQGGGSIPQELLDRLANVQQTNPKQIQNNAYNQMLQNFPAALQNVKYAPTMEKMFNIASKQSEMGANAEIEQEEHSVNKQNMAATMDVLRNIGSIDIEDPDVASKIAQLSVLNPKASQGINSLMGLQMKGQQMKDQREDRAFNREDRSLNRQVQLERLAMEKGEHPMKQEISKNNLALSKIRLAEAEAPPKRESFGDTAFWAKRIEDFRDLPPDQKKRWIDANYREIQRAPTAVQDIFRGHLEDLKTQSG